MDRTGPDEFAVESRAPLTIPPDFELRPPAPGTQRPQDVTAAERARKVIETAGPGEPGKQATVGLRASDIGAAGTRTQAQTDPTQQVGDQSLSSKLLGYNENAPSAAVEQRETKPLKGVY